MGRILGSFHHRVTRRLYVGDETTNKDGWDTVIPPSGRCPAGGGAGDNRDVHLQTPEYGRAVHRNATYSQPVSGGGAEGGLAGTHAVAETGGSGIQSLGGGGRGRRGKE